MTIICAEEAGIPIKCYSPELIIYPMIHLSDQNEGSEDFVKTCESNYTSIVPVLERNDSIVIGPGAGRHPSMIDTIKRVISFAVQCQKPLVIDGDGLWVVTQNPTLVTGLK